MKKIITLIVAIGIFNSVAGAQKVGVISNSDTLIIEVKRQFSGKERHSLKRSNSQVIDLSSPAMTTLTMLKAIEEEDIDALVSCFLGGGEFNLQKMKEIPKGKIKSEFHRIAGAEILGIKLLSSTDCPVAERCAEVTLTTEKLYLVRINKKWLIADF